MTIVPLTQYLRTYRKRTGLTHDEVAFLMGGMCGTTCQRHEIGRRYPSLTTVLKYEIVFNAAVADLYRGLKREVRASIQVRARGLVASLEAKPRSLERDRKLNALRRLLIEDQPTNQLGGHE